MQQFPATSDALFRIDWQIDIKKKKKKHADTELRH